MYKLCLLNPHVKQTDVQRLADNAFIPMDQTNTDYQEYLKWLAEGNVPLPPSDSVDEVAGTLKETPDAS